MRSRGLSLTIPEDWDSLSGALESFIGLPNSTPFFMLKVYRFLRDAIPDVSDGVWTWKRLCQTGFDVEILDESSKFARRRAQDRIDSLNRRAFADGGGMDGLLDVFYTSLFTYGAAAFELVLSRDRLSIHDIVPVDIWTIRFKRNQKTGKPLPYQVQSMKEVALNPDLFVYFAMDRDGTNPYGRSMLRAIPFVVKIQHRMMEDMAKATHASGWSRLHVKYHAGDRFRGESIEDYEKRVMSNYDKLKETVTNMQPDQNLVTYDNVSIEILSGNQRNQVFYQNQKAIEEQVITGMHLMPILMGRNYGSTETYGTAQYEIINRNVTAVNRCVKRFLERIYNFELRFLWGTARAKVRMRNNRTVDFMKEVQSRGHEITNAVRLRDEGFVTHVEAKEMLGV